MDDCLFCDPTEQAGAVMATGTMFVRFDKFPATPGHVEVVPWRHVESFFDLTAEEMRDAFDLVWAVRSRLAADQRPDGWNIGINDGEAAGQSVPHLHIHLIPRYWGDQPDPRGGIRRGLPNGDPGAWTTRTPWQHRKDTR